MNLTGEDRDMLNGSLAIMKHMYDELRGLKVVDAKKPLSELPEDMKKLYERKDGKDTRFFDVVAEKAICLGNASFGHYTLFQRVYDQSGVVITEERGRIPRDRRIEHNTPIVISDPVDRSSYLEKIIEEHKECETMGELFDAERESIGEAHTRLEACNSSVTLLKDNMIKYSIVLNLFTGEAFVAYAAGVFCGDITQASSVEDISNNVEFKTDETLSMLCYCKGEKYQNNFDGTHLRFFLRDKTISSPGGPNRFIYLLREEEKVSDIGVIAHNGEKIQESLPNIAVAFFSNGDLEAYKLFCDRDYHEQRAGIGLTPNLQNSIYNEGLLVNSGIKLVFLNNHDYPSQFRDTTVIVPNENEQAKTVMRGMVDRDYAIRIV